MGQEDLFYYVSRVYRLKRCLNWSGSGKYESAEIIAHQDTKRNEAGATSKSRGPCNSIFWSDPRNILIS